MGTIAQKLEYLNDTRLLLKDNINKINNVLDDNSTFRSYPQELFNGYLDILNNGTDTLWNNLEKVSATGEEATLENVETAPMKIELSGNTSQDTTSGKNKFSINQATYVKKYGSSYSVTGEEIIVTPTTTWGSVTYSYNVKNNTTYTLKMKITFEGTTQTRWWLSLGNETNEAIYNGGYINLEDGYLIKTFTTTSETLLISFQGSTTIQPTSVLFSEIQLEEGSTATSYEPYTGGQPSPSPDYPQQVKVVKGENVVSVSGKNLLPYTIQTINETKTGVTFTGENGIYTISGVPTTNTRSSNYQLVNEYTIKDGDYVHFLNDKSYGVVTFGFLFTDNTSLSPAQGPINRIYKFADAYIGKTIKQIYMYVTTAYDGEKITIKPMILNNISTYTDFVPYSKTDYPINLGDIELCKINTYKDYFHKDSGKWYVHKEINKLLLDENTTFSNFNNHNGTIYITANINNNSVKRLSASNIVTNYSDKLKGATGSQTWTGSILNSVSQQSNGNYLQICLPYATTPSLADLQTWIATNNILVYFVLENATEEEITNTTLIEQLETISKAKSVKDKTYITQTNEELPFILDVEAIKEYEVN